MGCSPVLSHLPPSSPLHPSLGVTFQQILPSILQGISSLAILWQHNRFFSFLHTSHPAQWGRAGLSLGAGSACGDPMDVSGLLESKFGFHFSLISIFFLDNIQYWGNRLLSDLLPLALLCHINQLIFKVIFWHTQRYKLGTKMFWAIFQSSDTASWWQQRQPLSFSCLAVAIDLVCYIIQRKTLPLVFPISSQWRKKPKLVSFRGCSSLTPDSGRSSTCWNLP